MHKTQTVCLSVEECCSQCVEGDLADLQTHQAGEENHPLQGEDAPEEVPPGHLRVSGAPPLEIEISYLNQSLSRLRKVKMDQRKLMDNANTITDMAKVKTLESQLSLGVRHFIMNNDEVFLCYQLYI